MKRPPSRPTDSKKRNDIRKALGRARRFSRPLKTEELSKKSTRGSLTMGWQKSAHKNFIKKVVVWGFLSVMRRMAEIKQNMRCVHACVCMCERTSVHV